MAGLNWDIIDDVINILKKKMILTDRYLKFKFGVGKGPIRQI